MSRLEFLPLTPERARAAYAFLRAWPPFTRMRLPAAADVRFRVRHTAQNDGQYWRYCRTDDHTLEVHRPRHSHLATLLATVAHEMIHLHQARAGTETRGEHNAEFRRIAARVCRRFGFDFGQFI